MSGNNTGIIFKRSEVLKELSYIITSIKSGPEEYSDLQDAKEILDFLEKDIGMLPPAVPVEGYHPESVFISQWRSEDET